MNRERILLGSPINLIKGYILYDWLEYLSKLTYPYFDIFLVDNSHNKAFHQGIRNLGYDCQWIDPDGREARDYMAESVEIIRRKALFEGYDKLFLLECDIFPPIAVIEMLLAHHKEVVGACYWTGHGDETRLQLRKINEFLPGQYLNKDYTLEEAVDFMDGTLKPAYANGNGCILIDRSVLSKITFHIEEGIGFADNFFHNDLLRHGIINFVDTSIRTQHYNLDWNIVIDNAEQLKREKQ